MVNGRRRHRRRAAGFVTAPTNEKDWSAELELLAYLMHCLRDTPEVKHFKATISDHLSTSFGVSWDSHEVDRQIQALWNRYQAPGYHRCDHVTLYYRGIGVLNFGVDDIRIKHLIRKRANQIQWELVWKRGLGRVTRSQRVNQPMRLENEKSSNGHGMSGSQRRARVTVEVPVQHLEPVVSHSHGDMKPVPYATTVASRHGATPPDPLEIPSSVPESGDFEQSNASPVASASPESKCVGAEGQQSTLTAAGNHNMTSPLPVASQYDQGNASTEMESTQNKSFGEFHTAERHLFELTEQAEFYRQESAEQRKCIDELKRHIQGMEDAEAATSASDPAGLKAHLAQSYAEIKSLRTQVNNKVALQPFTRTSYTFPLGPEKNAVVDAISSIEADTFNILVSSETTEGGKKIDFKDESADLSVLWATVFGDPAMKVSGVSFQTVVRSLTSAALYKWVFEPHAEEPLFVNSYRGKVLLEHIADQDGPEVARRLDFAALETMYKTNHYQQKVIPGRATVLAQRLFEALSALIDAQSMRRQKRAKLRKAWRNDMKRLEHVFEAALRLKARTMTGDWLYKVILPASGATFQEQYMRVEEGDSQSGSVQLTLALGICCYKQTSRPPGSNSFGWEGSLPPESSPAWIHKATVLLDCPH